MLVLNTHTSADVIVTCTSHSYKCWHCSHSLSADVGNTCTRADIVVIGTSADVGITCTSAYAYFVWNEWTSDDSVLYEEILTFYWMNEQVLT